MQLAKHNTVLMWVPGHEGTDGNKMANQLAKMASEQHIHNYRFLLGLCTM
jgi:ribonuclease HI